MIAGGVVLAGGRSTRMGRAKADLDWNGRPLVVHVATTLRAALDGGPVVVVRAPGQRLPPLPHGLAVARDSEAGRGPLQGLVAGLTTLDGRAQVAVAVATDQPFAAAIVPRLLAALQPEDDAVAVEGQPLGALYRLRAAAVADARLRAGDDTSLRGLLRALRTRTLAADAATDAALRSLDTPEAYARALAEPPRPLRP